MKNIDIFFITLFLFSFATLGYKSALLENFVNKLEALPNIYLSSNLTAAGSAAGTLLTALNGTGFSLGTSGIVNTNTNNYISWAWKEDATSGLDIVTYTGNAANRTIEHELTSHPEFMLFKRTDAVGDWGVYHKSLTTPNTQHLTLNSTAAQTTDTTMWNSLSPFSYTVLLMHGDGADASTTFTDSSLVDHKVASYGNAQIDTAQSQFGGSSILFDGVGDRLSIADSPQFAFGSSDYTIDFWVRPASAGANRALVRQGDGNGFGPFEVFTLGGNYTFLNSSTGASWDMCSHVVIGTVTANVWTHIAVVRDGNTFRSFKNGVAGGTCTSAASLHDSTGSVWIGGRSDGATFMFDGHIDELRFSKGIARWTSGFTPPASPHTTSGESLYFSLGTNANVNANAGSYVGYLFDEKAGFSKFSSYTGNGSADGPFVYTGFKPKYVMVKRSDSTGDWYLWDSARDTYNPFSSNILANTTAAQTSSTAIDSNANGFKIRNTTAGFNTNTATYIYAAFAEYPFERAITNQGYTIASSTRFNGTNAYLNKTLSGSPTDGKRWTYSTWFKRNKVSGATNATFLAAESGNFGDRIYIDPGGGGNSNLVVGFNNATILTTNHLFRDPSKWYHLVVKYDSTQATAQNRLTLYIDGTEVTSFSTDNRASIGLNSTQSYINNSFPHNIAKYFFASSFYSDIYLADTYFIDGQSPTPTDFGQFDTNGNWGPKNYTGAYGTNGFKLDFANASDPGNDVSGNNNDFTSNNIATTDNVADTPTNNFVVGNPLQPGSGTFSSGNLTNTGLTRATTFLSSGQWYWETTANSAGVVGGLISSAGTANTVSVTNGTTRAFRYNAATGLLESSTDGSSYSTVVGGLTGEQSPYVTGGANSQNFGQGGQAGLTYNSASGGYFKYTPTTGFKALSSANMITAGISSIAKPKDYFQATTYTGTGAALNITSLLFEPALLWIKNRSAVSNHAIFGDGSVGGAAATFFQWFEF